MTTETFDLTKALAGHPVKMRNGDKAFVRHQETEVKLLRPLIGVKSSGETASWSLQGGYLNDFTSEYDIISMWTEPLTMPDSFWECLDPDFTQITKDGTGDWYAYTSEPLEIRGRCNSTRWYFETRGEQARSLNIFNPAIFPTCKPEDSLITRPEGK